MRRKLKELRFDKRYTFVGTFERFGTKHGYMGDVKTVLLKDIHLKDETEILTDHLWFNATKGFENVNPTQGDQIQFNGRVEDYQRGYNGYREDVYIPCSTDYKICFPTKVVDLSNKKG